MPLPNVVFYPHTLLPLHVFEPRYRKMAEHCLEGEGMLGVVLLKNPREAFPAPEDPGAPPQLHKVLGVGKILDHERMPDGKLNLKLEGRNRVMILDEIPSEPFRTARVEIIKDHYDPERQAELAESRARMESESQELSKRLPRFAELIDRILSTAKHPGIMADLLAAHFVVDLYDRQSILTEFDVIRRVDLVAIQMEAINRRVRKEKHSA